MATARNRGPARQRDHHVVEEGPDRAALTSRVGRRPLSLRTARIHRRQRNAFRRRLLVRPLDDAQSGRQLAETNFISDRFFCHRLAEFHSFRVAQSSRLGRRRNDVTN
jgi:hypothetical protein